MLDERKIAMQKLLLFSLFMLGLALQPLYAVQADGGRSEYGVADRQLYHVYWNVYNRLSPAAQLRLKADEIRWINWKDTLPLVDRIEATYERIAILEQL
jgi:hypothetical protein